MTVSRPQMSARVQRRERQVQPVQREEVSNYGRGSDTVFDVETEC